jgi:hypothetical protein
VQDLFLGKGEYLIPGVSKENKYIWVKNLGNIEGNVEGNEKTLCASILSKRSI